MAEIRAISIPGAEHLNQLRELYCEAGWIEAGDAADFLVPAITGSTVAAGAFENGELVGFGRALSDGCSDAYIQDVVVARSHRKQGVGKELILRLQSELEKCGIDWIGLVGAPGTENFYRKIGLVQPGNHTFYQLK
jgi:spermidine synthase